MSSNAPGSSVRPWRIAAPWVVAGLLLVSAVVASATVASGAVHIGPSVGIAQVTPNPPVPTTVNVNLTDAPSFDPSAIGVNGESSVTFHLMNVGNLSHSFTLARQANTTLNRTWSPTQLDQYFAQYGSLVNTTLSGGQSAEVVVNFTGALAAGTFEFVSIVPYQFQAGMEGLVTVTPTPGGNATTSENTTDSLQFVPNLLYVGTTSSMHFPILVHVQVYNLGGFLHTFSLAPQSNVTLTLANWTSYFAQHGTLANVTIPSGAGQSVWANFSIRQPGVYMYICEEPGHFASGMFGYLYVDVPLPAISAPSTAVVYTWVLGIAIGLVGVGVVLAVVAAYTGRFPPG